MEHNERQAGFVWRVSPLPLAVSDPYMSDQEYLRLLDEDSSILKEQLKAQELDLSNKRTNLRKLEGKQ